MLLLNNVTIATIQGQNPSLDNQISGRGFQNHPLPSGTVRAFEFHIQGQAGQQVQDINRPWA